MSYKISVGDRLYCLILTEIFVATFKSISKVLANIIWCYRLNLRLSREFGLRYFIKFYRLMNEMFYLRSKI